MILNNTQTSSTGKRDPTQHRKWIKDLVHLLFQVKNDDFEKEITSKPYLKYVYQTIEKESKPTKKEVFLETINECSSIHLYKKHPLKKRGYCLLYIKKSQKSQEPINSLFQKTFQLNQKDWIEFEKRKELKRSRFRSKKTKW